MRRLIYMLALLSLGCAVRSPAEGPPAEPVALAKAAIPASAHSVQAASPRPQRTPEPVTIRMVGTHRHRPQGKGSVWRSGEARKKTKPTAKPRTVRLAQRRARPKKAPVRAPVAPRTITKTSTAPAATKAPLRPAKAPLKTSPTKAQPVKTTPKAVKTTPRPTRTSAPQPTAPTAPVGSEPVQVTHAVGQPVAPQLQTVSTVDLTAGDDLPADEEPASAPAGFASPWVLGGGALGLGLLGLIGRALLGREEAEEESLPLGVPTSMWWIEAKPTTGDAFLLEFTCGEGDRHVACDGLLSVKVSARSCGSVIASSEVAVSLEDFHADVFGRPRYGGEFPCGKLSGTSYEWLEAELTLTPCDGQPLTGAVRFMHPGPRSSEA